MESLIQKQIKQDLHLIVMNLGIGLSKRFKGQEIGTAYYKAGERFFTLKQYLPLFKEAKILDCHYELPNYECLRCVAESEWLTSECFQRGGDKCCLSPVLEFGNCPIFQRFAPDRYTKAMDAIGRDETREQSPNDKPDAETSNT